MAAWLLKTEPEEFSWQQLVARGARGELWDGIRNHQAAAYMRQMQRGDRAFVYHTGKEKRIVGVAEVLSAARADAQDETGRFVTVMVRARDALPAPVTLAELKRTPALADFILLRQGRLSVLPVTDAQWQLIHALGQQARDA